MRPMWVLPVLALTGCGLDDSELVECRCGDEMVSEFVGNCVEDDPEDPRNPMTTRLPDCPSGTPIFLRERTTPASTILNVETTFENFSPNQYMEQLADDFIFIPDPVDVDLHPEIYDAPPNYDPGRDTLWAWEAERTFVRELLDRDVFQRVDFIRWYQSSTDEVEISDDGLSELYIFPYEINITELPVEGSVDIIAVKGRIEILLVTPTTENPVWSIRSIVDIRDAATAKAFVRRVARPVRALIRIGRRKP